jgi:hypothetical protein
MPVASLALWLRLGFDGYDLKPRFFSVISEFSATPMEKLAAQSYRAAPSNRLWTACGMGCRIDDLLSLVVTSRERRKSH